MVKNRLEALAADITDADLFSQMFDDYPDGVMVLNMDTVLVYYNKAQGLIDDIDPAQAIGKTILDLYRVNDNGNYPTLRCLFTRKPLINYPCYYYTHLGKLINSIHNVFPLFSGEKIKGCICFIRDYGEISAQYNKAASNLKRADNGGGSKSRHTFAEIVTQDAVMREGLEIISRSANSPSPIMIYGETGCGKEMFAQAVHDISSRRQKSFMAVNCAAIPESLLEGMLFGTVKGAFTGAMDKPGIMEMADGGTIFLDEINSMPPGLQSKMLRAIQDQKIRRIGASREKPVSMKIISATNTHPHKAVAKGDLRADLLFRLGVVMVEIPPLRERRGDIPILVRHFIKKLNQRLGKKVEVLSPALEEAFGRYHWPGNVRELEHAIEGAMNIAGDEETLLKPGHFKSSLFGGILSSLDFVPENYEAKQQTNKAVAKTDQDEVLQLMEAMEKTAGNAAKAARLLNISPQLMNYKLNKYGLKKKK